MADNQDPENPTPEFDKALNSLDALIKSMRDFENRDRGAPQRDRGHVHKAPVPEKGTPQKEPEARSVPDQIADYKQQRLSQEIQRLGMTRSPEYDSPERRAAIREHLRNKGVEPRLQEIRDLYERGNAAPPSDACKPPAQAPGTSGTGRTDAQRRAREERERGGRER